MDSVLKVRGATSRGQENLKLENRAGEVDLCENEKVIQPTIMDPLLQAKGVTSRGQGEALRLEGKIIK